MTLKSHQKVIVYHQGMCAVTFPRGFVCSAGHYDPLVSRLGCDGVVDFLPPLEVFMVPFSTMKASLQGGFIQVISNSRVLWVLALKFLWYLQQYGITFSFWTLVYKTIVHISRKKFIEPLMLYAFILYKVLVSS